MIHTSADDVDTMVDDQPIMLPAQRLLMREYTPPPQPRAPAPWPETPKHRPRPRTPETHLITGLEHLRLMMLQRPPLAVPTLGGGEAAASTLDVDVQKQLLRESAGSNCLANVSHPDAPLTAVGLDGLVGEERTSPRIAEEVRVVVFW
jgi:hypothetical protein